MVTFAQAQERAEEWINGDVPGYQHREVRVREFELGFVVWAEDRETGPVSDGGRQRLVIARDSGEATLWPALPVGEVIRRYEEEYGLPEAPAEPAAARPPERVDLNQTSFLLSPPEWLQEAADKLGIPDRRENRDSGSGAAAPSAPAPSTPAAPSSSPYEPPAPAAPAVAETQGFPSAPASPSPVEPQGFPGAGSDATPWAGTDTNGVGDEEDRSVPLPETVFSPPLSEDTPPPGVTPEAKTALMSGGSQLPPTAVSPALREERPAPMAPPAPGTAVPGTPPPGTPVPPAAPMPPAPHAPGAPEAPSYGYPQGPGARDASGRPLAPGAGDIADAATSKAQPPARGGAGNPPPPPGAPGVPGAPGGQTPPPPGAPGTPGAPAGGYVPTQLVSSLGPDGQPQMPGAPQPPAAPQPPGATPPPPGGGVHHAATMLAGPPVKGPGGQTPPPPGPPGAPGVPGGQTPPPPGPPGAPGAPKPPGATPPPPGGGVHHAATMLASPGPQGPMPPGPVPPAPAAPGPVPPPPPGAMPPPMAGQQIPGAPPAAYGYPQPPAGQPTVGPGYQAVLRYRAPDGSEQQLIRRSAPGMPHPEWQIFHELRGMNIPPDQVLELHTELESCALPGAYCSRMIKEQWPQARITSIAPYGADHASRQQGMQQLIAHQGELHQVADGPARPAPVRAPLPPAQPMPPVPPEGIAQELGAAFGPGVFRFDQRAVSRQGVPDVVAHVLVVAGLPADFGPFFWAQAQPGRPVPTLAELAAERGVQPASDAGSYLVMGSDFGKAVCVQYGTAHIVAVPVEAGPGGGPVPPQFVNSGLPEFARSLALLGRMWRLRFGLNPEQAGRWTVDFQAQLNAIDPAALGSPETWWSVLLEQMWDGLL
ncbi:SUKH-4 family immunity protein [Streptomyces sp. NPDC050145]|uniref:SUKH-4 family immunity protein n=1 Tax=Streptomyces sp. NPDC050145 TaxID=3365602 RepID=UPI0037B66820